MTLRRQYQLGSDIFDTGPFAGYRGLGNGDEDYGAGTNSNSNEVSSAQDVDLSSTEAVIWSFENGLVDYATAYNTLMNTFSYSDNDINDLMTYEKDALLLKYEAELDGLDQGLAKENIVYTIWQDVYYTNKVMELITVSEAKAILAEQFAWNAGALAYYPSHVYGGMADYNADSFLEQFERSDRELSVSEDYNPNPPANNYAIGEYISPSVGNAVLADQPVPGGSYHYWDGNMDTHDWGYHGISLTEIVDGTDGVTPGPPYKPYPKPIVDAIGGYAMCISHYLADYDNTTGAFNGFRVLTAAELGGGVPAGLPIATVMQMFVKCAETHSGKDFDGFTWTGANFYYDTEKNPIWRKSIGMPMDPADFFLLEPELALENKISKITNTGATWDVIQNTQWISANDAESWNVTGYNDVPGIFKEKCPRQDVLNRNFGGVGWGSFRAGEKSKRPFGAKVEYLGEGGQFNTFSVHPPSIADCNTDGKTMVIFRFPRQLDPVADKKTLELYANDPGVPDYSFDFTKYCYPYPGASADKDEYALLGRLTPTNSDDIGADKFTAEIGGETFGGRQSIKFVPMVSASMPPSSSHRPYFIGKPSTMTDMKQKLGGSAVMLLMLDKVDYFCFDTTSVSGATISVADPNKTAFFNNSKINNAYFINRDFDVGSTAFAIGQCMLSYEKDSAAIDNRLGLVDSSERMILTTRTDRLITSEHVGFRSDDQMHRNPRDGTAAGNSTSDYLEPTMTMTTDDLLSGDEPIGALAVRETFQKIFGFPLTPEWFATLNLSGQDPNNPLRYVVSTNYGTFSYPYSIVGFTIPGYYVGPVLKYDEEGNPVNATEEKPGYIGDKNTFLMYQSPFGQLKKHTINFHDEVQAQITIEEGGGTAGDVMEGQTESESGAVGEDYVDVTQENQETIQYEEWLQSRLMEDHGNSRFTDTGYKANFRIWNQDYVLGKDLINAGYPIPGVDLSSYEAEAAAAGIPIYSTTDEPTQIQGLGAFTNSEGFTVTDVTAKWGTLGMAKKRYTGDVGMSMVPYSANVQDEQLGYMAMSNLGSIDGVLDDAKNTGKDLAMETAKWTGIAAGTGAGISLILLAGGGAVAMVTSGGIKAIMGGLKSNKKD